MTLSDLHKFMRPKRIYLKDYSDLMINQYEARKDKFVGILIDELVAPSIRSARSIHTIKLIIDKFYPENGNELSTTDTDLAQLELAI